MSINILGGAARGFTLATPKTHLTRPTSVLLKRRLFDSIQTFKGEHFVDLCAGSGSIGLEALSRGADLVELIEMNKKTFEVMKKNVHLLRAQFSELGQINIYKEDSIKWLKKNSDLLSKVEGKLNIFFDPPYEKVEFYDDFFTQIRGMSLEARVIVEACQQKTMRMENFCQKYGDPHKILKQGTSFFAIYNLDNTVVE